MKVLSTYKILKAKAFNEDIDESFIDWAIEMIEAGYESDNLYMLAGETKPYNQFQLQELTKKILEDFGFNYTNRDTAITNYIYYLITNSIDYPETYYKTLRELKNICLNMDMDAAYMDFYLLYHAKEDLIENEFQCYWGDANRENIDQIIKDNFKEWVEHHSTSGSS